VQDTALNGAQIESLLAIIASVAAGTLPKPSAEAMIIAAFPSIEPTQVSAMLNPIKEGSIPSPADLIPEPVKTEEPKPAPAKTFRGATKSVSEDDLDAILLQALRPERLTVETLSLLEEVISEIGIEEAAKIGASGTFNMLNPLISEYIGTWAGTKISGMANETTREELRAALLEGVRAGEGIPDLSKRVRGVFEDIDANRATIIARTEVVGGSNRAIYASHVMSGVVTARQWVGTPDGRSRDSHKIGQGLSGQVRSIGEKFKNKNGNEAMHPGGFHVKSEDIQCRCTTVAVLDNEPKSSNDLEILQRDFEARIEQYEEKMTRGFRRGFKNQREDVLDAIAAITP